MANGIGNFVSRVVGLVDKFTEGKVPDVSKDFDGHPLRIDNSIHNWKKTWKDIDEAFVTYRFDRALTSILEFVSSADKYIDETKPWVLAKENKKEELNWVIYGLCDAIHQLSWQLLAFLPETSENIAKAFQIEGILKDRQNYKDSWTNIKPGTKVSLEKALFPRLN